MKKVLIFILALLLLAVPVSALEGSGTLSQDGYMLASQLVQDQEELLDSQDRAYLEDIYHLYAEEYGFTPILHTVESFHGMSAEECAGMIYDQKGYPEDGILYLVSLTEGEWYILTNGQCYYRISNSATQDMGDTLVEYLRDGDYYDAFALFPELAAQAYTDSVPGEELPGDVPAKKNYGKTIAISMAVGLAIGGIAVGIMALQMKSVRQQQGASDYVRSGSMQLHDRRDIFLYSHVTRTAKPKNTSSGSSGGGSRGGAGGKI
jgi:uncharacterized protein